MHIDNWIELDKDYMFYLNMKERVIREQGKTVVDSMPENDEGCRELLEVLVDYLPKVDLSFLALKYAASLTLLFSDILRSLKLFLAAFITKSPTNVSKIRLLRPVWML
jgi:hypothetical protein